MGEEQEVEAEFIDDVIQASGNGRSREANCIDEGENDDDDDDDGPSSKRQNMRSSRDYSMDIDEHQRQVVTSTPEVGWRRMTMTACPYCETIFKSVKMLNVHMSFHSDDNPFTCKSCGTVCNDSYEFELHLIQAQHNIGF